jgi:hypothetical protein
MLNMINLTLVMGLTLMLIELTSMQLFYLLKVLLISIIEMIVLNKLLLAILVVTLLHRYFLLKVIGVYMPAKRVRHLELFLIWVFKNLCLQIPLQLVYLLSFYL